MSSRPLGVLIVAILLLLFGVLGLFGGLALMMLTFFNPLFILLALIRIGISLFLLYLSIGLLNGKEMARILTIFVLIARVIILILLKSFLSLLLPSSPLWNLSLGTLAFEIIFVGIIIFYLTRPHVKAFFGSPQYTTNFKGAEALDSLKEGFNVLRQKSVELAEKFEEKIGGDVVEELKEFREKRNDVKYCLENLHKMYNRGEISESSYNDLKKKYEDELKFIEERIAELTLKIKREMDRYKKEIEKLEFEKKTTLELLDNLESKHRSGELHGEELQKRKSELENRFRDLERKIENVTKLMKKLESAKLE